MDCGSTTATGNLNVQPYINRNYEPSDRGDRANSKACNDHETMMRHIKWAPGHFLTEFLKDFCLSSYGLCLVYFFSLSNSRFGHQCKPSFLSVPSDSAHLHCSKAPLLLIRPAWITAWSQKPAAKCVFAALWLSKSVFVHLFKCAGVSLLVIHSGQKPPGKHVISIICFIHSVIFL